MNQVRKNPTAKETPSSLCRRNPRSIELAPGNIWSGQVFLKSEMYGGLQCPLRSFMDVVVELGRGDGSAAWTLALLSASTWMAATLYPKHVVDDIFSGGNFRTAGVLAPRKVKTRRVDGGGLIEEGSWSFNSGVQHAQWDILGIPIFDDAGQLVD